MLKLGPEVDVDPAVGLQRPALALFVFLSLVALKVIFYTEHTERNTEITERKFELTATRSRPADHLAVGHS